MRQSEVIDLLEDAVVLLKGEGDCDDLVSAVRYAIAVIQGGRADKSQEWIPCSERLPSKKEVVLITNDKGNVRCGQFRGTDGKDWIWKGNTLETVLAWKPLPKPFEPQESEEKWDD